MEHSNLIIVITIIGLASTLGTVYVVIKKINISPSETVLTRRGDIELNNYNEPTQPLATYYPSDWWNHQSDITSDVFSLQDLIRDTNVVTHQIEIIPSRIDIINSVQGEILVPRTDMIHSSSNGFSSISNNFEPSFNRSSWINSCLENESIFNSDLINNLLENNLIFYGLGTVSICLITGFWIKSYFTKPNDHQTGNYPQEDNSLTLEQLSEIINKLNRGEILEDDIRDKLDQDFKILVNDILSSSGHHPLANQPVYINSCLEFENSYFIITIILFVIILFIIIYLFLNSLKQIDFFNKNY